MTPQGSDKAVRGIGHGCAGAAAPRRERVERGRRVHRLDRRRPQRPRRTAGPGSGGTAGGARPAARRGAHLGAAPGRPDGRPAARLLRPILDPRAAVLAAQLQPLRRAGRTGQGRGAGRGRGGAVHGLAPRVLRAAAVGRGVRRSALRRHPGGRAAAGRVTPRGDGAPAPLLVRRGHPRPVALRPGAGGVARQHAARTGQAHRADRRRRGLRPRGAERAPAVLRVPRGPTGPPDQAARPGPLGISPGTAGPVPPVAHACARRPG
jgi:hypothetical protein